MTIAISGTTGITLDGQFNSASSMGFKNRLINSAMVIDQRNAGASVTLTSGGIFTVDRFLGFEDTDGGMTAQQNSSAPTGFVNSLKITTTSADASLGATQYCCLQQRIEGFNIADLNWGTANAATVTLSFWVRSSLTGTFGGALLNGGQTRSYPFTYTISVADTWEQKSVTIAGDTTGTWATTNTTGFTLSFGLGVGSTYSGTAGAWAGALYLSATGATSVIGTNSATFYITGVQLEKGSTATSFDYRPYGTEIALCQRYYEKSFEITTAPAQNVTYNGSVGACPGGGGASSVGLFITWKYAVIKRASPTMTSFSVSAANSNWYAPAGPDSSVTAGFTNTSTSNTLVYNTSTAQTDRVYYVQIVASSEL